MYLSYVPYLRFNTCVIASSVDIACCRLSLAISSRCTFLMLHGLGQQHYHVPPGHWHFQEVPVRGWKARHQHLVPAELLQVLRPAGTPAESRPSRHSPARTPDPSISNDISKAASTVRLSPIRQGLWMPHEARGSTSTEYAVAPSSNHSSPRLPPSMWLLHCCRKAGRIHRSIDGGPTAA